MSQWMSQWMSDMMGRWNGWTWTMVTFEVWEILGKTTYGLELLAETWKLNKTCSKNLSSHLCLLCTPEMFHQFSSCPPADVPDVNIIPLYPPNTDVGVQSVVGMYTFTFNGKLDPEQLGVALYNLIKFEWRILGARLVYNSKVFQKSWPYLQCSFFFVVHFPDEKSRVPCSPYIQLVNATLLIRIPDLRCPSRQIHLATETFPQHHIHSARPGTKSPLCRIRPQMYFQHIPCETSPFGPLCPLFGIH